MGAMQCLSAVAHKVQCGTQQQRPPAAQAARAAAGRPPAVCVVRASSSSSRQQRRQQRALEVRCAIDMQYMRGSHWPPLVGVGASLRRRRRRLLLCGCRRALPPPAPPLPAAGGGHLPRARDGEGAVSSQPAMRRQRTVGGTAAALTGTAACRAALHLTQPPTPRSARCRPQVAHRLPAGVDHAAAQPPPRHLPRV